MRQTIPLSVIRDLAETVPGFAERCVVRKVNNGSTTLKQSTVRKAAPSFASILRGSPAHKAESAAPKAISSSPSKPVAPGMSIFKPADPSAPAKALPAAYNTPKTPIPSRHEPVTYASLQAAIDTAMSAQRDQEKREAFERGRSSFARLTPSKQSDAPRGGMGDAWSLRNASGKLVQAVLGVRKGESNTLPTNTAFRPFSASHKG